MTLQQVQGSHFHPEIRGDDREEDIKNNPVYLRGTGDPASGCCGILCVSAGLSSKDG